MRVVGVRRSVSQDGTHAGFRDKQGSVPGLGLRATVGGHAPYKSGHHHATTAAPGEGRLVRP